MPITVAGRAQVPATDVTRLATGAGISLAGKLVGRGLHVVGQIVLARLLGPAVFGLYAIGWTLLHMIGVIALLGLDQGVIRYGPRYWRTDAAGLKGVLFQSLGLALLSGLLMGAGLYLAAPWLATQVFGKPDLAPVLRLFALAFPLITGLRVAAAATRVSERMQFSVYSQEIGQPATNLLLILVFYLLGWHLLGAVAAGVASFGLAFLLALYYIRRLFPESFTPHLEYPGMVRELIHFSLPASFAGMFTIFTLWVDRLIVAYFRPAAEVGIYQAVSQSSILFAIILSAFNSIFAPIIVDLHRKGEKARLEELFRVSTKWGLYLCLPVFLVICFAPGELLAVIFGSPYAVGWLPLVILSAGQMVSAGTGAVGLLLMMTGHQNRWLWLSGTMMLVNVVLNLVLIPRWGITGAALATACAVSGLYLLGLLQVKRTLRLWPYDRRYLKGLLAAAVTTVALFLLRTWTAAPPVLDLLLTLLVSAAVFGAVLLLSGLDAEDREFLRVARARLASAGAARDFDDGG
jgi:O-antigen/teichoic acid export membrane protein